MKNISASLKEYGRGIAGGLLFSLPLFFTEEMWQAGLSLPAQRMLAYLLVTFLLLMGYNRYAGLHAGASWTEIIVDSIEEMGLGLLLSAGILQLIGQLDWFEYSPHENLSKIIMQSMPVAIGISIGTAQFESKESKSPANEKKQQATPKDNTSDFGERFVLAACGSVLVAGNMAPTHEVVLVAAASSVYSLITTILVALTAGILILFYVDFRGAGTLASSGRMKKALLHTMTAYIASVVSSALMLWFFGQLTSLSLFAAITCIVVLSFPAMLGASAGRLLIKGSP